MISKRDLNFNLKLKFRCGVVVVTKLDPSPPFISCRAPSFNMSYASTILS